MPAAQPSVRRVRHSSAAADSVPPCSAIGDRVLDLAFRERREPDPDVIGHGRIALTAYLAAALRPGPTPPGVDAEA